MKKILTLSLIALAFASCKKYDCECTTDYYDANYSIISTTTETHTVKATGILKATEECNKYDANTVYSDTYCYIQ